MAYTGEDNMNAISMMANTAMAEDPRLLARVLDLMPPDLWYVWIIVAFATLDKYASECKVEDEYEEFLAQLSRALETRVKTGVW